MDFTEKKINGRMLYDGRIIKLIRDDVLLPNGNTSDREVVLHPGGVCIAALTDDNQLLFVEQFRYPYGENVLELPAGKLEKGQDPLENGKRELLEETGAVGYSYMPLGCVYPSPGYLNEVIHLYFCRVQSIGQSKCDEDEFLNVIKIPLSEAVEMVMNNRIADAKTQIAVLKTALLLSRQQV